MSLVLADIHDKLSVDVSINQTDIDNLLAFAMSGAGLDNFNPFVKKWNSDYINQLSIWFEKWKSSRSFSEFYSFLLEKAGYKCQDVSLLQFHIIKVMINFSFSKSATMLGMNFPVVRFLDSPMSC